MGNFLKTTALSLTALVVAGAVNAQDYGSFEGYTLRVKLIGGAQYEPLYTLIPQWEEATGATVEILSRKSHFELDREMKQDIASGNISIRHGFRGPNFSTVSACASSSHSMIDAFNYIRLGKADVMISGGSEAAVIETGMGGFNAMHALSTRNDSPETASRPFDKERDGFVLGEGSGAIILEEYEHAVNRGANIYAEIVGGGLSADAHHITAPHPEGLGAINVMRTAMNDHSDLDISEIDYINVHGTSTPLGDIAETKAIKTVFGEHAYQLNISSTKSMTGHLLGAAGAIEGIATILAVKNNIVPPTINHFTDDPELDPNLNFTFNTAQEREVNAALSNTFGFGGHIASVVFRKFKG